MKTSTKLLCLVGLLIACANALGHHSFSATFKANAKIQVEGVVTRYSFRNPHVNIYFDVTNPDGSVTSWISEGAAATNMRRQGWGRDTFKEGDRIRVYGDSTHDGSPMIANDTVWLLNPDGSVGQAFGGGEEDQGADYAVAEPAQETATPRGGERGPGGPGAEGGRGDGGPPGGGGGRRGNGGPDDVRGVRNNVAQAPVIPLTLEDGRPNFTSVWSGYGAPYHSPRDPFVPLNEKGQALQADFSDTNDPQVFCDDPGLVRQTGMTPHPIRITQYEDRVEFDYEEYAGKKVVYFDPAKGQIGIPTHLGDSVARYEGDSLVIETHNLLPGLATAEGNRLTDEATVTQYYSRIDKDEWGSVLMIKTVTRDPNYLAEDFVIENAKVASLENEFIEVECVEPLRERIEVHAATSFFVTSVGLEVGSPDNLSAADAHCETLADNMEQGDKDWRAYLGSDAQTRIGSGPWYNAEGTPIAKNLEDLHADSANFNGNTVLNERADSMDVLGESPKLQTELDGGLFYCFAAGDFYSIP